MSQHDYVIDNGSGLEIRGDLNDVLQAIASNNAGATAPATTYPNMWWFDTVAGSLKIRDDANTQWLSSFAGGQDLTVRSATPTTGVYLLTDADRVSQNAVVITTANSTNIQVPENYKAARFKIVVRHTGCTISIENDPVGRVINGITDGAAISLGPSGATVDLFALGSNEIQTEGEFVAVNTLLGALDANSNPIRNFIAESEKENIVSSSGNALTVNVANGNNIYLDLTENISGVHSLSNVPASGRVVVLNYWVVQDSTDRTMNWPASFDWGSGSAPSLPSGEGEEMLVVAISRDGGTSFKAAEWWRSV